MTIMATSGRIPSGIPGHRITGLETEYGCLVRPPLQVSEVMARVRDWIFDQHRYGLIDVHDRDWDEPAGNGGFLFNGGRLYQDMGHLEYCTAECASTLEVLRYDRAGDQLLNEALKALELEDHVSFIRNNVDHYTGATFGCHENYSLSRIAPLSQKNVLSLLGFLTLRALYVGAGRVGISPAARLRSGLSGSPTLSPFQISQRADYIQNDFFEWVQHNRAIINTRDEPLADPRLYRRLHLIHGDTSVLPATSFLKIGTTRLVFDLLEVDDLPAVALLDAVTSLRELSRTLSPPWLVQMGDGRREDAISILWDYQRRCARRFAGRDLETDAVLDLWARVLEALGTDKKSLVGIVDWVTKEELLRLFCESEGIAWTDPWLESQDLEYHNTQPQRCLATLMAQSGGIWETETGGEAFTLRPPAGTRASIRSEWMRAIRDRGQTYVLDWDSVQVGNHERICLMDPFACQGDPSILPKDFR